MRLIGPLVAVLLAAAACGGSSAEPSTSGDPTTTTGTPTSTQPTSTTAPSTNNPGADPIDLPDRSTITQADAGTTFTATLGSRIELQLTNDYLWSQLEIAGPGQLVVINYVADPGFAGWEVLIEEAGIVTITALGTPNCETDDCGDEQLDFTVTIEASDR